MQNQSIEGYIQIVLSILSEILKHDQGRDVIAAPAFMKYFKSCFNNSIFGSRDDLDLKVDMVSKAAKVIRYIVNVKFPESSMHQITLQEYDVFNEIYRTFIFATQNNLHELEIECFITLSMYAGVSETKDDSQRVSAASLANF